MNNLGKNLSTAILAAVLATPFTAFALETAPDQGFDADVPALGGVLTDSRIAVSAEDPGTMRGFAARSFSGLKSGRSAAPVVSAGEGTGTASGAAAKAAGEAAESTTKASGDALSSNVPALAAEMGDSGNIAQAYTMKGLKTVGLAVAGAALIGGAVAGGLLFGGVGVAIGLAAGAIVLGVVVSKVLHSFWNSF